MNYNLVQRKENLYLNRFSTWELLKNELLKIIYKIFCYFVDIKKVFDSINRSHIWMILNSADIPGNFPFL